jgi:polyisoprenoid-binding protein YceI
MTTQAETFIQTSSSPASAWEIDTSHASAGFKVRHMMVANVRGELGPVSGTVWLDERQPERSRVDVRIDVRGINTREPKRDEHLRSADFFDAENHPEVRFVSTEVKQGRQGLVLVGDLTIRGVTRSISLDVEPLEPALTDPWGNTRRGVAARGRLNRKDFGLEWNMVLEAGGFLVGDRVDLEIEAELTLKK